MIIKFYLIFNIMLLFYFYNNNYDYRLFLVVIITNIIDKINYVSVLVIITAYNHNIVISALS